MATPRKRYFRVGDSILREPWSRELKLICILLQAHLNTRWRRDGIPNEEAGRCYLSQGAIFDITGRKRIRSGLALLSKLSERVSLAVELRGDYVFVDWPKFVEFQSFDSRSRGSEVPRYEPPPSPSPSPLEEQPPPTPPAATRPKVKIAAKGVGLTDPPPRLSDAQQHALAAWVRSREPDDPVGRLTPLELRSHAEECLDWFRGAGKRKKDWVATIQVWTRKNVREGNGKARASPRQGRREVIAAEMQKSEDRDRERAQQRRLEASQTHGSGDDVRRLRTGD